MMKFIRWLIFIKIVLPAVKQFKKVVKKKEIEKDCNKKEWILTDDHK